MNNKLLISLFAVLVLTLVLALGAVKHGSDGIASVKKTDQNSIVAPGSSMGSITLQKSAAVSPPSPQPPINPGPNQALMEPVAPKTVQDSDLQGLAEAINFASASSNDMLKAQWARQVPVAQQLVKGACDCDQRNWLNHFIETGDYAVAGSPKYYASLKILADLPISDSDAATLH